MVVPTGSVFGLLGPNGAGKTTCLRLLAGLTRPTAGRAFVSETLVAADALAVRRRLGYLEQDPRVYGWMTGREQLAMLGRLHGLAGSDLERSVAEALGRVDLLAAADRRAGTYSGGMRQRLGIAGALVHRPPVVILDEPVSALDPEGRRDVLELIASLRGTTTILFSTHVLADVERICDRVGILDHGRLVVEGPLAELLDRFALPVYRVEAEPGQATALQALAASLRELPWVTGTSVDHGLLTVAVADPGGGGPGAAAGDRGVRARRHLGGAGEADPRGRLPAPHRRGGGRMSGFGGPAAQGARRGVADPPPPGGRAAVRRGGDRVAADGALPQRDPRRGARRGGGDPAPGAVGRHGPRAAPEEPRAARRPRGDRAGDGLGLGRARPRDGGPRPRAAGHPPGLPRRQARRHRDRARGLHARRRRRRLGVHGDPVRRASRRPGGSPSRSSRG